MTRELKALRDIKEDINVKKNLDYLIGLHNGIFYRIVNNFLISDIHGLTKQDVVEQKLAIFWQAAVDYDESRKVRFVTWLGNSTFFFLSKEYNKVRHFQNSLDLLENPIEAKAHRIYLSNSERTKLESVDLIDFVLQELQEINDDRIIKIFELRYFKSNNNKLTTWREIGKTLSLTGQSCINLHKKGLTYLQQKIKYE